MITDLDSVGVLPPSGNLSDIERAETVPSPPAKISGPAVWEVLLWMVGALTAIAAQTHWRAPAIGNDGFQYQSVAANIRAGNGIKTSIVYYDAERGHKTIPAPLTTFPPLYPAAIAALSPLTGGNLTSAGAIVSLLCIVLLIPVLAFSASSLGFGATGFRIACVFLLANSWTGYNAMAVASEALFTLTVATAAVLLCRALAGPPKTVSWIVAMAGGILLGGSYWIRYAGIFFFIATCLWTAFSIVRRRALPRGWIAGIFCGGLLICLSMLRNILLIGTWEGGTLKPFHNPIGGVLHDLIIASTHWFFGGIAATRPDIGMVLFGLAALGLAVYGFRTTNSVSKPTRAYAFLWVLVGVYIALLTYTATIKVISFNTRMFFPLTPLAAVILADVLTRLLLKPTARKSMVAWVLTLCLCAGYILLHARHSAVYPATEQLKSYSQVEARLSEPSGASGSAREWISRNTAHDEVITAADGQATAYVIDRPTLALPATLYTAANWTDEFVQKQMTQVGSRYVLLYPRADAALTGEHNEWPFQKKILSGIIPPWLEPVLSNNQVIILRRR